MVRNLIRVSPFTSLWSNSRSIRVLKEIDLSTSSVKVFPVNPESAPAGPHSRYRLKELTQCMIDGFGLLKRRQMAAIRNDLKPGVREKAANC